MNNLDLSTLRYSDQNALWLCRAARLAYHAPDVIQRTVRSWGFSGFHFFDTKNTQAFLAASDRVVVLAFRGTESRCLRDWMTDAGIILVSGCAPGKVHTGFADAIAPIWPEVRLKVAQMRRRQPLLITGHSLGGALATLAMAKLVEQAQPVRALYTYGSPRVGDPAFTDWCDRNFGSRSFRIVNNQDVVTRVAPRALGYSHIGQVMSFDAQGMLHTTDQMWKRFLDTVKGGIDELLEAGPIKDHDLGAYEANLAAMVDRSSSNASKLRV